MAKQVTERQKEEEAKEEEEKDEDEIEELEEEEKEVECLKKGRNRNTLVHTGRETEAELGRQGAFRTKCMEVAGRVFLREYTTEIGQSEAVGRKA